MTPDRWQTIESLFNQAHELPPGERAAWLERHTDDPAVRAAENAAGRRIGQYRILRLLGQGGMGSVYLAERDDAEFRKQVAIKVLRSGVDGPAAVDRFRQERQILAGLEHPNIARLLDGGATADGLPYLVMEYVEGQPLRAWIEARRPAVPERLRLFREVCAAVQFAHQNLVVHRDLKASNILVTAEGSAKLLDFGIAKLIDDPRSDQTLTSHRAFTPNYASPVRDAEPPRPSGALGGREGRKLRDDLDHIVLKALRRDPAARYASAEQLSADILNYLEGRPVRARRGTLTYRARRFVARRRWAIVASVAALAAVGAGVAGTVQQRRKAERRFAQVRSLANTFLFQVHDGIADLPGPLRCASNW